MRVGGLNIRLTHSWTSVENPKMWYSTFREDRKPKELIVETNVYFDAYSATSDKVYYATANVAAALARVIQDILVQQGKSPVDFLTLQEDILLSWGRRIQHGLRRTATK